MGRATRRFTHDGDSVLTSVRAAWAEASGPGTVNHAYPIRRSRAGVVTVACTDAVWAQELDMRGDELMDRLATILGDPNAVGGLRFVVADHAIPQPDPGPVVPVDLPPPSPTRRPPVPARRSRLRTRLSAILWHVRQPGQWIVPRGDRRPSRTRIPWRPLVDSVLYTQGESGVQTHPEEPSPPRGVE